MDRRTFLRTASAGVAGALTVDFGRSSDAASAAGLPLKLEPSSLLGGCTRVDGPAIVQGALWYEAQKENDGLAFRFEPGALASTGAPRSTPARQSALGAPGKFARRPIP